MSDTSAIYDEGTVDFQFYTWNKSNGDKNTFNTVGIDLWLYNEPGWDGYVSYLEGSQASGKVDNS